MAVNVPTLEFLLPGDPQTLTGGYEYDRRIGDGLRSLGWKVGVHSLDQRFPFPTAESLADADRQLAALPDRSLVLIDGLALGAMPGVAHAHAERLKLVGLMHHPLAAETGLPQDMALQLFESERRALKAMRMVIVTSHTTRRSLAAYGVSADRIGVVEPGIDQPAVADAVAAARNTEEPLQMLCVATITPRKGHDVLVDALADLRNHAWVLNCVGDTERSPETTAALRSRIAAAGLADRIRLLGALDAQSLARQFQDSDLFVLATHFEGYGMAVAQALAYGLPVISTRTGAIDELVPEHAGLLVQPNDVSALRDALASVFSHPFLRRSLAQGAGDVGRKLPSWRDASERFAAVLLDASARL